MSIMLPPRGTPCVEVCSPSTYGLLIVRLSYSSCWTTAHGFHRYRLVLESPLFLSG